MNHFLFVIVLIIPMVNDLLFHALKDMPTEALYLADTSLRILSILIIGILIKRKLFTKSDLKLEWFPKHNIFAVISLTIIGMIFYNVGGFITFKLGLNWDPALFSFREPTLLYKIFDLSVGLFLVGFVEEVVYRALIIKWLTKYFNVTKWIACLISIFLFGITHYGDGGLEHIGATIGFAIPYTFVAYYSKGIWALIIAHWLTNFINFI